MPKSIVTVAIGDPAKSRDITNMTQLNGVRPYITGLIHHLSQQMVPGSNPPRNYTLGADYVIHYRECLEDAEDFTGTADVIFCMSTPVVKKARHFTNTSKVPVVGIFSDQVGEQFDQTTNICGVNAQRFQIARQYYDKFLAAVPGLQNVAVLHRVGNTASTKSLAAIHAGGPLPVPLHVLPVNSKADIQPLIDTVRQPNSGLLVLPVDLFFGSAEAINAQAAARSIPVFWPVPDWVAPGIGGFGVAQETCGEAMGKQVQFIFEHPNQIPQGPPGLPRFIDISAVDQRWVASKAAAKTLKLKLEKHAGLHIV